MKYNAHRRHADNMRQEDNGARDIAAAQLLMHQQRQQKSQNNQGNRRQNNEIKRILQRLYEEFAIYQLGVILKPDPFGLADDAPFGEAGVDADRRR